MVWDLGHGEKSTNRSFFCDGALSRFLLGPGRFPQKHGDKERLFLRPESRDCGRAPKSGFRKFAERDRDLVGTSSWEL